MSTWKRTEFAQVKRRPGPEDSHYNTQNVLIAQVNFPIAAHVSADWQQPELGDIIGDPYSDRLPYEDKAAAMALIPRDKGGEYPKMSLESYLQTCSKKKFLAFVEAACKSCIPEGMHVTGARVIRFTNVSSGHWLQRYDFIIKHPDTPVEPVDPETLFIQPKERVFLNFGMFYEDGPDDWNGNADRQ